VTFRVFVYIQVNRSGIRILDLSSANVACYPELAQGRYFFSCFMSTKVIPCKT